MNSAFVCFTLVAASLALGVMDSFAKAEPVSAYRGNRPSPLDIAVERGMSRSLVRQLAGEPDGRLGTNIWIYVGCRLTSDAGSASENDTLCMGFSGERVAILKLVPRESLRELVSTGKVVVLSSRLKALLHTPNFSRGGIDARE